MTNIYGYPWNYLCQTLHRVLLVSMAVKQNNVLLNLITGCLYWLTTCFGHLHDHHQVYMTPDRPDRPDRPDDGHVIDRNM